MSVIRAIALALLLNTPCVAREAESCGSASSTTVVQLTITLKADRTVFEEGEIIPLSLSFTSTNEGRYLAENLNYDYSGRVHTEIYCVAPEARDPLESYFVAQGDLRGGPGSPRVLGESPFALQVDLNEFRTLAPGRYRLHVISRRVWRRSDQGRSLLPHGENETLRSNSLEFEIKPASPQWQHEQLQSALRILKQPPSVEEAAHAVRRLRFLNSRDSTKALARLLYGPELDDPYSLQLQFGLFGSPYRQLAIDSMREEIMNPEHAISWEFLNTLAELQITADPLWNIPVAAGPEQQHNYARRREEHKQEVLRDENREVLASLPHKVGRARPLTAAAVMLSEADDPEFVKISRATLIATWNDLPELDQQRLIDSNWRLLAGPDMVPILIHIVSGTPARPGTFAEDVRYAALRHILELDPVAERPLILRELQRSGTEPSPELLKLLPAEDAIAAIQPTVARIAHNLAREEDFERLGQFGDATSLVPMKAAFEGDLALLTCNQRKSMLQYFLRVAPDYGAAQVEASLKTPGKTDCRGDLLSSLDDQLPLAEKVAIKALDDPESMIVRDAAAALSRWGSPAAEAPLWARLERFQRKWRGHEDELARSTREHPEAQEDQIERDLIAAIAEGTSWLCTREKLQRLRELAVTEGQRAQVDTWIDDWKSGPPTVVPEWWNEGFVEFSILACSGLTEEQLKAKLSQLPHGTRVLWEVWQPGSVPLTPQQAEYEKMRAFAEPLGVTLVRKVLP
jgi:hypothetical protein